MTPHPDLDWAASGAMAITGTPAGPPLLAPAAITASIREAVGASARIAKANRVLDSAALEALDAPALLGERAAAFGQHERRGQTSVGGSCRILRCRDGWIAVSLAREEDFELVPAWLGGTLPTDTGSRHAFIAARLSGLVGEEIVARGRELGLACAAVPSPTQEKRGFPSARGEKALGLGPARAGPSPARPLVVDLSALWAGPLCSHLLQLAGARVIKVESTRRPDGARGGPAVFYDLVNANKRSVALDFAANDGIRALRELLARADIVIEGSRPRALRQLGIVAEEVIAAGPGKVWVSITGYGREEPVGNWVAFGDDAAAAAGLVATAECAQAAESSRPVFCGDAIADPLTGAHAARAALEAWQSGQSTLVDVALYEVAACVAARPVEPPRGKVVETGWEGGKHWAVTVIGERAGVAPPRARPASGRAAALGADTLATLTELGISC